MNWETVKIGDEILTPDGYTAVVLLCVGRWVTMVLTYTHPHRFETHAKTEWS